MIKFARITSRLVAGGATAALASAGLVGLTGTAANAAVVTSTYTCTPAIGSPFTATVGVDIALPATGVAGLPVPAGLLSFNSTFKVSNATATGLNSAGVTGGKSDDFGAAFGDILAKAPVVWNTSSADATDTTFTGKGANVAFLLPKAGTYTATMPTKFNLQGTNSSGATVATVPCASTAPASIGTITLSKQLVTIKAKATPASAKKGAVVTVKGKIKNEYVKTGGPEVTGKVIIKDGKKKVGTGKIKKGKFTVKLKGLAVGSHVLTVSYKGDDYTDKGVSKELKVNVKA